MAVPGGRGDGGERCRTNSGYCENRLCLLFPPSLSLPFGLYDTLTHSLAHSVLPLTISALTSEHLQERRCLLVLTELIRRARLSSRLLCGKRNAPFRDRERCGENVTSGVISVSEFLLCASLSLQVLEFLEVRRESRECVSRVIQFASVSL